MAVGNLLRRLACKCAASAVADKAAALLAPHQLGVGIRGGCEAAAHAVKEAIARDPSMYVLQLDLVNAFNSIDRSHMLGEIANKLPDCLAWVTSCYGTPSHLQFGPHHISSTTGVHQGDPLAALIFSLVLHPRPTEEVQS